MSNTLSYKGFTGSVEFSEEDNLYFGKVLGIKGLISYEGKTYDELVSDFQSAIDDYMELLIDQQLLEIANERMSNYDPSKVISEEEMNRYFGITEDDLKGFEDIDIEIEAVRSEEDSCSHLAAISESLFGLVPDTLTLEEVREERLKEKYDL